MDLLNFELVRTTELSNKIYRTRNCEKKENTKIFLLMKYNK